MARIFSPGLCEYEATGIIGQLRLVRIAAIALLLYTGADLLACDLLLPTTCELAGAPTDDDSDQPPSGDDCFCCCFHVVIPPAIGLEREGPAAPAADQPEPRLPVSDPARIFHPPKF